MKPSPLVIMAVVLAVVISAIAQLTHAYGALANINNATVTTAAAMINKTTFTVTNASVVKQYDAILIYVLIIDNSGHAIASYLINGSKITIEGNIKYIHPFNNSLNYYVAVINMTSGWFGYIKVPGKVLNEVIKGGNYTLYSWVISSIKLKPLNQYPKSSLSIIIKAPNGELIKGGTLCIHPIINGSPKCIETTNSIVKLSNLTTEPYLVFYGMRLLINVAANVYGYTINTTLITNLIGDWLLIPSNETVTVTPSAVIQQYTPSGYYLYEVAAAIAPPVYTTSITVTAIPLILLHPTTVLSISNIAVILMLIAAILGGVIALLTVPRTIRRTH